MNVNLTPQLEAMIRQKVESGSYNNASEVVRDALRLMAAHDAAEERLRAEVGHGFEQLERGEAMAYTPAVMKRLKREAAENARQQKPVKDAVTP